MNTILTKDLELEDIPNLKDSIKSINNFAVTYDWKEIENRFLNIDIESDFVNLTISELRYVLYCEQRRWNHFGKDYDYYTAQRIRLLIKEIREKYIIRNEY